MVQWFSGSMGRERHLQECLSSIGSDSSYPAKAEAEAETSAETGAAAETDVVGLRLRLD